MLQNKISDVDYKPSVVSNIAKPFTYSTILHQDKSSLVAITSITLCSSGLNQLSHQIDLLPFAQISERDGPIQTHSTLEKQTFAAV